MPTGAARGWLGLTAVLGALGVGLGAVGAHALRERLPPALLEVWRTAVLYHLVHVLALLALELSPRRPRALPAARGAFVAGILLFSGSLYALCLSGRAWLGAVTPFGGVALIAGWLLLAAGALFRLAPPDDP